MEPRKNKRPVRLDQMREEDWSRVCAIYCEGIATGNATFETEAPSWDDWNRNHRADCRIVARHNDDLLGWAALSPVSGRCVYGGVGEVSVYVSREFWGQGLGRILLQELIRQSEEAGLWTLQAGIFPENVPSLKIHEALGFRVVGTRRRIGRLKGRWRDVVLLERRSEVVGSDRSRSAG